MELILASLARIDDGDDDDDDDDNEGDDDGDGNIKCVAKPFRWSVVYHINR